MIHRKLWFSCILFVAAIFFPHQSYSATVSTVFEGATIRTPGDVVRDLPPLSSVRLSFEYDTASQDLNPTDSAGAYFTDGLKLEIGEFIVESDSARIIIRGGSSFRGDGVVFRIDSVTSPTPLSGSIAGFGVERIALDLVLAAEVSNPFADGSLPPSLPDLSNFMESSSLGTIILQGTSFVGFRLDNIDSAPIESIPLPPSGVLLAFAFLALMRQFRKANRRSCSVVVQ
ncbi:MAG: hypothetical protein AAF250_16210 [Pseudomonadota bacterium]